MKKLNGLRKGTKVISNYLGDEGCWEYYRLKGDGTVSCSRSICNCETNDLCRYLNGTSFGFYFRIELFTANIVDEHSLAISPFHYASGFYFNNKRYGQWNISDPEYFLNFY